VEIFAGSSFPDLLAANDREVIVLSREGNLRQSPVSQRGGVWSGTLSRCDTASLGVTDSDDTILPTPERPGWESRARYRPQREETIITWRGSHGRLTDQEHLPLCRLRYLGSDTDGG
jgi:hypothetical protein